MRFACCLDIAGSVDRVSSFAFFALLCLVSCVLHDATFFNRLSAGACLQTKCTLVESKKKVLESTLYSSCFAASACGRRGGGNKLERMSTWRGMGRVAIN